MTRPSTRDKALDHADRCRSQPLPGLWQCVFLAPVVFELHGEEALMYDPGPDDEQLIPVVRAAAACPVQAIRLERRVSKHELGRWRVRHEWSSLGRRWPGCGPRRRCATGGFGVG